MKSIIYSTTLRLLTPILWIMALWLFLRGHNAPGGGFIAALVAATSIILKILDKGWNATQFRFKKDLFSVAGCGLALCILSGVLAMLIGNPFMTGRWITLFGKDIGSPLLFDLGIFLVVYSSIIVCAALILEENEGDTP